MVFDNSSPSCLLIAFTNPFSNNFLSFFWRILRPINSFQALKTRNMALYSTLNLKASVFFASTCGFWDRYLLLPDGGRISVRFCAEFSRSPLTLNWWGPLALLARAPLLGTSWQKERDLGYKRVMESSWERRSFWVVLISSVQRFVLTKMDEWPSWFNVRGRILWVVCSVVMMNGSLDWWVYFPVPYALF